MKLVYVCSPYRGKTGNYIENYQRAKEYCKQLVREGYIPIAPHVFYTQLLGIDDTNQVEREEGLKLALEALSKCEKIFVFGTEISEGMEAEIEYARMNNIEIERRYAVTR